MFNDTHGVDKKCVLEVKHNMEKCVFNVNAWYYLCVQVEHLVQIKYEHVV